MSIIIDLAMVAVKAVSAARAASRLAGHESTALNEVHDALGPARQQLRVGEAPNAVPQAGPADPGPQSGDSDDGGLLGTILDWIDGLL